VTGLLEGASLKTGQKLSPKRRVSYFNTVFGKSSKYVQVQVAYRIVRNL
jgi:hypothetical protein